MSAPLFDLGDPVPFATLRALRAALEQAPDSVPRLAAQYGVTPRLARWATIRQPIGPIAPEAHPA